ncbi:glycosyltransferase [Knoellia locipacati]|uniref:glycosyltransferase n=1 Tax=Knoellia locipacati TaxID=882824 RepID=UPI00164C85B0|nr:glycosyltransferase [Knoellia locipacati]
MTTLWGVLVTYRREALLADTLARIADQSRPPDQLVVVDNGSDPRVRTAAGRAGAVYIDAGDNLGPAGGIALGMDFVLERAGDDDWLMLFDDDDPPETSEAVEEVLAFAQTCLATSPRTAAVGLVGARYDRSRGRVERVPDDELSGPVEVDYIGGGQLPVYRCAALRDVGVFDTSLFFGFDDLEHGLRLRRAGYSLFVDGGPWLERRRRHGRTGATRSGLRSASPPWRTYYSARNLALIAREHASGAASWRVAVHGALAGAAAATRPGGGVAGATAALRGAGDALLGRRGRRVEPVVVSKDVVVTCGES